MMTSSTVLFTIFCDDASHAPKTAKVAMFTNFKGQTPAWTWDLIAANDFTAERHSSSVLESRAVLGIDGQPYHDQLVGSPNIPAGVRLRFKLDCPLCGHAVTVKGEKLDELLNILEPHAVASAESSQDLDPPRVMRVSLRSIAARVLGK